MRIDKYLADQGYTESRQKAKLLISEGFVSVNGKTVTKDSFDVTDSDDIKITGKPYDYVSRGGLKLEGAQREFSLDFNGKVACDVGASTGGFTDVMLRGGIAKVYAVDCGSGQLHKSILSNPKVINIENFNARNLTPDALGEMCDIVVSDISFISQTLVHEAVSLILKDGGEFVSLIKPQFESGRENIGKGGIVKDPRVYDSVIKRVVTSAERYSLYCQKIVASPINGSDGNREFLAYFVKGNGAPFDFGAVGMLYEK